MSALEELEGIEFDGNYTKTVYHSQDRFDPGGIGPFFDMTVSFMESLFPTVFPPELHISVVGTGGIEATVDGDDYAALAKHYVAILTFLAFLLAFAILMPLVGFSICCCRCCCSNNKQKRNCIDQNPGGNRVKKVTYVTLLIVFGALFCFGMVCAFWSNEHLHDGTNDVAANLQTITADVVEYFDNTVEDIDLLLETNFDKLKSAVVAVLDSGPDLIFESFQNVTNATSIQELFDVAEQMKGIKTDLEKLKRGNDELLGNAEKLQKSITAAKTDASDALKSCSSIPDCQNLKKQFEGLDTKEIAIPDINAELAEFTDFFNGDIFTNIETAKDEVAKLQGKIKDQSEDNFNQVKGKIDEAGSAINDQRASISTTIEDLKSSITTGTDDGLEIAEEYIQEYSKYPYYINVAFGAILALILLFLALAVFAILFLKRPKRFEESWTQRTSGHFLMGAVAIMFITALFMALILLVHVVGSVAHVILCEPLRNLNTSATFQFYDESLNLEAFINVTGGLREALISVHKDESIYNVFNLKEQFDIEEVKDYITKFNIDETLQEIKDNINLEADKIQLLSKEDLEYLHDFAEDMKGIDEKFEKTINELQDTNFTSIALEPLITEVGSVIEKLGSNSPESVKKLRKAEEKLKISKETFEKMQVTAQEVVENAKKTAISIKFGKSSFKEAIEDLAEQIKEAQKKIKDTDSIIEVIEDFANTIIEAIKKFLNLVADDVSGKIGKTEPLSHILNATLVTTCDKIVLPMGGFALSILWCIVLFIPIIFISFQLNSLYSTIEAPKMQQHHRDSSKYM